MKKNILFMVVAMLCLNYWVTVQAQNQTTTVATQAATKPLSAGEGSGGATLKVGDKVPASFWAQEHQIYQNGKIFTQTLASCKGKLLILDFWASWCGSCLKKFAMADSLQQAYGDGIAIVLVNAANTRDNEAKIAPAMQRHHTQLPSIIFDTTLTKLFPHAVVPHYIWIEQGQYRAATGTEFFTAESIAASVGRRKYLNKASEKLNEPLQ